MMRRFQSSSGQGVLEVVLVVAAFSALVAVATPVYLGFQGRKADKAAQAAADAEKAAKDAEAAASRAERAFQTSVRK